MRNITIQLNYSAFFTVLTAVGAFIKIPFIPVPFTLQTFFTIMAGFFLIPRYAVLCQLCYLLIGLIGLPVFSHGGGIGYITQPTFGYLLGLPLAAMIIAKFKRKDLLYNIFLSFLGAITILVIGSLWLVLAIKFFYHSNLPMMKTFYSGFVVFLPAEFIKAFTASYIYFKMKKRLNI